jgi:hypothetical protein
MILAGLAILDSFAGFPRVIEQRSTADGRYDVQVIEEAVLVDSSWTFVIRRHAHGRLREVEAGCISSEAAEFERVESIRPGRIIIRVSEYVPESSKHQIRVVDVRFDPDSMRVTQPIPAEFAC